MYVLDYCQAQYLIANCTGHVTGGGAGARGVVLMQSARYGRMKLGACGTGGSTNVAGCSEDVLWYLDRRCSARRHCKVYVADPVLHHLNPCDSDYSAYLSAKYTCVPGSLRRMRAACVSLSRITSTSTLHAPVCCQCCDCVYTASAGLRPSWA